MSVGLKGGLNVAIIGATGAVGRELLSILESRQFPIKELRLFSSPRSEGKSISLNERSYRCKSLKKGCFEGVHLAFFDASDAVSKDWVMHAAEAGCWVVDNSATFRMEKDVLLIVPEVNGHLLRNRISGRSDRNFSAHERIIAGPNCSTVQLVVALKPIQERWGIKRVVVSSYQSTSGAGTAAMEELSIQTVGLFNQRAVESRVFPHQIAFNCIPHIGGFKEGGYTGEEQKIILETRKILDLPHLPITATAVRVPTFSCHAESVNVECEKPFALEDLMGALRNQEGVIVLDDPKRNIYPMGMTADGDPVERATGKDAVYIGRVRIDSSVESGVNLWVVSDNLRKGAALNAVQVGELLLEYLP